MYSKFRNRHIFMENNIDEIDDVILNREELMEHARFLSRIHKLDRSKKATRLLSQKLNRSYLEIFEIYKQLNEVGKRGGDLSPASEWLLDNFYRVEEQVKDIRHSIKEDRFIKLPILTNGYLRGYPRVYAIALELVSHTDGKLEEDVLIDFVKEYQSLQTMGTAEVWSLSLMARVALIDSIRIISRKIYSTQLQWIKAEKTLLKTEKEIYEEFDENLEKDGTLNNPYIEHILARLRRRDTDSSDILEHIEARLYEYNTNVKDLIQNIHKEHAIRKISIGNSITSLHNISTLNWNDIFEAISLVEQILRKDPLKVYPRMDFSSRDSYRRAIERIWRKWNIPEVKIANLALKLSQSAVERKEAQKEHHIGYYLIDKGRSELFKALKIEDDYYRLESISIYAILIGLSTLLGLLILGNLASYSLTGARLFIFYLILFIPSLDIALHIINNIFMKFFPSKGLPRLEFEEGIPKGASTMVIIPALLIDTKSVEELLERLEVYYLSNKDENIYFSIVGDFKDGDTEVNDTDDLIIKRALMGIEGLNEKYSQGKNIFYYFHRKRIFNEKQKKWMGWERKRGAIIEFNKLLLNNPDTTFFINSDSSADLSFIRYVITIDSDTRLIMDSAKKLIGTISHPLNKAIYHEEKKVVIEGYGIIQPRIGLDIQDTNKNFFTRTFAYSGGIDPYTTAVSDIYQDVFGEGIFTGKGIYDLVLFNRVMESKIKDNTVLSHDLLEGSLLRTGLATDIELIDGYPTKYSSYIGRAHRWTRGDWQLIKWIFNRKYLSPLSRWKMLDNLRRSLLYPALFTLILLGSSVLGINILTLVAISAFVLFFPPLLTLLHAFSNGCRYIMECVEIFKKGFYQTIIQIILLPYNSYMMLDAIIRTLYRVFISKGNLLEWVTAADMEKRLSNGVKDYAIRMRWSYYMVVLFNMMLFAFNKKNLFYSLPLSILWSLSPILAQKISAEKTVESNAIKRKDMKYLRLVSRKTWSYYEDFVKEEYNYLPPDNYQEYPYRGVAYRTSPTNIGLYLTSALAARDFGYITTSGLLMRVGNTIKTISKMESWKGHLFNWYDIKTLEVLRPYYVSTVDSGNYVTYLVLLRQGLKEYISKPLLGNDLLEGLLYTFRIYGDDSTFLESILTDYDDKNDFELFSFINVIDRLYQVRGKHFIRQKKFVDFIEAIKSDINKYFPSMMVIKNLEEFIEENSHDLLRKPLEELLSIPSLDRMKEIYEEMDGFISKELMDAKEGSGEQLRLITIKENIGKVKAAISSLVETIETITKDIDSIVSKTEFIYLYEKKRNLFSIGYDVEKESLTNSYYDLLATEARTASYWAIVNQEVPLKHWYKLSRVLTKIDGSRALVSWTGTMFEYLMPALILKNYEGTLFDETYKTVVDAQKAYGEKLEIPWGVSESGFYSFDFNLNYQYKAFGIPDLRLKRGLIEDIVISPYSTFLALNFDPNGAMKNLQRLQDYDLEGEYGFYEALDFTSKRLRKGLKKEIVRNFMAHHQGMGLLSFCNFFYEDLMIKRFHSHPKIKAGEFMLQERKPTKVIITKEYKDEVISRENVEGSYEDTVRVYESVRLAPPPCHLLSNGAYTVLINNRGGGFSKYDNVFINRWRDNTLKEDFGNHIFIKNRVSEEIWSTSYDYSKKAPDNYKASFLSSRAEFLRWDEEILTKTVVFVSPEDNVEIRKLSIENHGDEDATFEITSFIEVALSSLHDDLAHRAFSNLFIRTEFIEEYESIIALRRPRERTIGERWAFHAVISDGEALGPLQYETSRANFIGRGKGIHNAASLNQSLTNTVGTVLEPCMSIRKNIKIEAGTKEDIIFVTGYGENRQDIMNLCEKYTNISSIERAYELSIIRSQVESLYLSLTSKEILFYDSIIPHLIYLSPSKRKYIDITSKNNKGQPSLWAYGISGDLPLMLLPINEEHDIPILKQSLKAHEYLKLKGLKTDLLILNMDESNYLQPLRQIINDIVESGSGKYYLEEEGGIYIRNASSIPQEDINLLYAVARVILKDRMDDLDEEITLELYKGEVSDNGSDTLGAFDKEKLLFFNGYGGFNEIGNEYKIQLSQDINTPAPWINVISNKDFGFFVSERGGGYIWAENSRENKLTPWSNDPVSDEIHEVIYLKDMEGDDIWTITPAPIGKESLCSITHGLGYSSFKKSYKNIEQKMTVFVPTDDSIKISLLRLKNLGKNKRKIQLYYYIELVLGVHEHFTKMHLSTEYHEALEMLIIKNNYNHDFPKRKVFMASTEKIESYNGDRVSFLGLGGDKVKPRALNDNALSNIVGFGYDPCGTIQVELELEPEEDIELAFYFGQVSNDGELSFYKEKYSKVDSVKKQLEQVMDYWRQVTNTVEVNTPEISMNIMLNNWLVYQALGCRLWARSAFYQSGGAFGFRDQLQDAINIKVINPELLKKQILLHCRHQFLEGDVQHWWHPGAGDKGVRTRFSDDLLWLPYAVIEYIEDTEDYSILEMEEYFLEDLPLKEGEDERYSIPRVSNEKDTVYGHCIRAIEKSLEFGRNGMPLMGSGDWNDGMSTVGNKGEGESVWLGFFLYNILIGFKDLCFHMGDEKRGIRFEKKSRDLKDSIEENGWDGNWYKRAFYDDGSPLGSSENEECMIDSIAQSWAVMSKAASIERCEMAMDSVKKHLVKKEEGVILLFTPPFDKSNKDPGYIKSYVPGVRENGGQYTHAATWVVCAFALLGQGDLAVELFNMLNPINHTRTTRECNIYKTEPYSIAADVYAINPHAGRGGWSWYTGAAGWLYRAGLEYILGFKKKKGKLYIEPCIPRHWEGFQIIYQYYDTEYHINVKNPEGVSTGIKSISLDGANCQELSISLKNDKGKHEILVVMGNRP